MLNIRPPGGASHPEWTDEKYCTYDDLNENYGYKDAYVKKLVRECMTEMGFRRLLGTTPVDKLTGAWVGEPPPTSLPPSRRPHKAAGSAAREQTAQAW